MRIRASLVTALVASYNVGCESGGEPIPPGARLEIGVAPLSLPGIDEACYTLTVTNGPAGGGDVVWQKAGVCSSDYGTGRGDLAYVGPCDASTGTNTVVLELTSLEAGGPVDFVNPCGAPDNAPCRREVTCSANQDRPVVFNLTVMRSADQGFFDVAVTFTDLFCSAKLDCSELGAGGEEPLELLFAPDGGPRLPSVVLGFACTGGLAADTMLYYDGVALACGDTIIPLPIAGPAGNVYGPGATPPAPLTQLATYRGREALSDEAGTSWAKLYFNLALALDFTRVSGPCDLVATASASDGAFTPPFASPADTTYPHIQVAARLVNGAGASAYTCTRHPLGRVPADKIWTAYSDGEAALTFDYRARAAAGEVVVDAAPVGIATSTPAAFPLTEAGGESAPQVVTVTATGPGHLVIGAITTTGDFAVDGHDCPGLLAPGDGCEVDVVFTPAAPGPRSGSLRIVSNAGTSPTDVALSGTGFDPAPTISTVAPNVGVNSGGTLITIGGTNFTNGPGASVRVGGVACGGASWSPTVITCTTPAGTNGARDVVVTNADGSSATAAGAFTYTDPEGWTAMTTSGAPAARYLQAAVWIGDRMLIAGGTNNGSSAMNDAARYDPVGNSWSSAGSITYSAWDQSVVWTGTQAIFFGGHPGFGPYYSTSQGSRYTAASNSWQATSTGTNVPSPRRDHCAVWTGSEMLVWGGYNNVNDKLGDGARYNPTSDAWTSMSSAGAPSARHRATCVWTGTLMLVWGGSGGGNSGGAYNPSSNSWTSITAVDGPGARDEQIGVWTGTEMIIWGGYTTFPTTPNTGAAYNPTSGTWRPLSTIAAPPGRTAPVAEWTGSKLIVWGGGGFDTGGVYTPATDTWATMPTAGAPQGRTQMAGVWSGQKLIVWGGYNSSPPYNTGARYTPSL